MAKGVVAYLLFVLCLKCIRTGEGSIRGGAVNTQRSLKQLPIKPRRLDEDESHWVARNAFFISRDYDLPPRLLVTFRNSEEHEERIRFGPNFSSRVNSISVGTCSTRSTFFCQNVNERGTYPWEEDSDELGESENFMLGGGQRSSSPWIRHVVELTHAKVGVIEFESRASVSFIADIARTVGEFDDVEEVEPDTPLFLPSPYELEDGSLENEKGDDDDRRRLSTENISSTSVTPNDRFYNLMGNLDYIKCPAAWGYHTGTDRAIVTIIDTGVDFEHPDISPNRYENTAELNGEPNEDDDGNGFVDDFYGWNAISNDGLPLDDQGHGTHVAGTVGAAGNNLIGVAGVSWSPILVPCKFISSRGFGSSSDAITCIEYSIATPGVIASCNSWGGGSFSFALQSAIQRALEANQLFIAAAGNDGRNTDFRPHYPSSYPNENIISVAATDNSGVLAPFSNFGTNTVDVAAPGVSIPSTYPDNRYAYASGTSMAAPHVAGLVALLKSFRPNLSPTEIKQQILQNVQGNLPVVSTGGIIDAEAVLEEAFASGEGTTSTSTATATITQTGTFTKTATETGTITATQTATQTVTGTQTATATQTATQTVTGTQTVTSPAGCPPCDSCCP